ncbi:SRPBCC family protein [Actinophytocola sp.]|uniref:SRPBCC family protein n=1 Tax=Actinophytocola sp. TaxID=1872138 RepID=UPI00389A91DF
MTSTMNKPERLARGLGWFSVGLGAAQVLSPRRMDRAVGVRDNPKNRAVMAGVGGARELAVGTAILSRRQPRLWLWARVAGDVLDLAMLGRAMLRPGNTRRRLAFALASVAGVTAADITASVLLGPQKGTTMELTATTTVRKPVAQVYEYWRRLENLPAFMAHVESIRVTGDRTSHWHASAPFGQDVEWDAEITEEVPGERIAWRSTGEADVPNTGTVRFTTAPDGVGTEVHVAMSYDIPGGKLGKAVARYFGEEPHQQLDDDLRRFKQVLETGEVVRSDGAPWGKHARREFPQRPAQPLSKEELAENPAKEALA